MSKFNQLEHIKEALISDLSEVINKYYLDTIANVSDRILAEWLLNLFSFTFILIDSDRKWRTEDLNCGVLSPNHDDPLTALEDLVCIVSPVDLEEIDLSGLNELERNDVYEWASREYRYANDEVVDQIDMPDCLARLLSAAAQNNKQG